MHSPNDCCLCTLVMAGQCTLHLSSAHPVPTDVDHVIHTPSDPVIPVLVTPAAVTCDKYDRKQAGHVQGVHNTCDCISEPQMMVSSAVLDRTGSVMTHTQTLSPAAACQGITAQRFRLSRPPSLIRGHDLYLSGALIHWLSSLPRSFLRASLSYPLITLAHHIRFGCPPVK